MRRKGVGRALKEKVYESVTAVLPITVIVLLLSITAAPLSTGTLVLFLFGAVLLILGMGGAVAWHFFKNKVPDQQTKGDTDLDDYDYGIDEDDDLDYDTEDEQEEQH